MESMRVMEYKTNGKWIANNNTASYNERFILECLTSDLIAKKLNNCSYIKSIKRVNLYNGMQKITVTYDDGFEKPMRAVYTIKNNF